MRTGEQARLARFFIQLGVKRWILPDIHVRPLVAELFLTENCNLRCISCACWLENTKAELTTQEWKGVIDQLVRLRIIKANFTGGEPLIRPDALEILTYAHAAGIQHMHLNTNGIRLTPDVLEEVLAAGVRSFNISVDGPDKRIHDHVRGRDGAHESNVAGISRGW